MSCPNVSFTIESKVGNLHKAGYILNFCSNFKNLSMNWDKYVFDREKWGFQPIGYSAQSVKGLTLGRSLLILSPLYVQLLKMVISTQTDNHT